MIQTIDISLIPSDNKPVINVSQFDNISRVLRFNVFDDADMETPHVFDDGDTVLLNIRKNDNNIVVITGVIVSDIDPETQEVTEQYTTFELTEQACACVGSNFGELSITSGDDEVIGSCNFKLIVERSPLSGGVSSQTAINNLTTQIEQITEEVIGENYYDKEEIDGKFDELDIPTKTSQLTNDSGFITANDIPTIPTKTSQLTNDSGFTTIDDAATVNDKTWSSDKISDELYALLPVGTASGPIANFNTSLALPMEIVADVNASGGGGTPTTPIPIVGYDSVKVGYVDFNQLAKEIRAGQGYGTSYTYLGTLTFNNGIATVTAREGGLDINYSINIVGGHKYLIGGKLTTSVNATLNFRTVNTTAIVDQIPMTANTEKNYSKVIAPQTATKLQFMGVASIGDTLSLKEFVIIDLTQAFGKEIADYLYSLPDNGLDIVKQIFTKDYYSYNVGGTKVTVDSVNGEPTCPNGVIALGQTIYGGEVIKDNNGTKLRVTHKKINLNGSESWESYASKNGYSLYLSDAVQNMYMYQGMCNWLDVKTTTTWSDTNMGIGFGLANARIYAVYVNGLDSITDLASWKTYLSNNPLQVVYPLAEPFTVELPDGEPITALVGDNNVYCDTGDTTVKYKDTIQNYIDTRVNAVSNRSLSMMRTLETLETIEPIERGDNNENER